MTEQTLPMIQMSDEPAPHAEGMNGYRASPAPAEPRGGVEVIDIYRLITQSLRGRYMLSLTLGAMCAGAIGLAVWKVMKPIYRSEAIIRIAYDAPSFAAGESSKPIEVYDAFMESQRALIASQRVMDLAAKDPAWASIGVRPSPAMMAGLATDLRLDRKSGAEHILVGMESKNPRFAAAAVQSVVNAYTTLYTNTDTRSSRDKIDSLESRRDAIEQGIATLEDKARVVSAELGSSNVEKFYDSAVQQLTKIDSTLGDVKIAMAMASAPTKSGGRLLPQQIARFDQTMARYLADREALESQLEQHRLRGYGEGHKQIIQSQKALETAVARISNYAVEFQNMSSVSAVPAGVAGGLNSPGQSMLLGRSLEELKSDEANLLLLSADAKKQFRLLGNKKAEMDTIKGQVEKSRSELAEISQKLSLAQLEGLLKGRMAVVSEAEVPVVPVRDRRKQMMAGGMTSGFFLPALSFVAVGFVRKRYRYSDDATNAFAGEVPLLGILPLLPHRLNDPESAADAAQCVHQIRVLLQVNQKHEGPVSYMVTSSCPGEGKTSLVTSLALSFAISGTRTLLIDTDLIGQRITRGFGAEKERGFRDILAGRGSDVSVVATKTPNLSLLPCGVSDGRDACAVSAIAVRKLLAACRKEYDVILVDSGPILGSLEALVVAGQVDGVILTISREQQKPLVDRAVSHLRSVGAQIAGMVFNKAERRDFYRSVSASSLRSISAKGQETSALVRVGVTATSGFGSLVDSVQSYMPTNT